jgi:hypothetical protein
MSAIVVRRGHNVASTVGQKQQDGYLESQAQQLLRQGIPKSEQMPLLVAKLSLSFFL